MVLERLSWCVTCPDQASFSLLTVARIGSCGPTRKLILLQIQSLVVYSKWDMWESFLRHWVSKAWILFFRVGRQGPCFTARVEDGDSKRFVQPELAYFVR